VTHAPRESAETCKPDLPKYRYSIILHYPVVYWFSLPKFLV
jgi:hypothetical protein